MLTNPGNTNHLTGAINGCAIEVHRVVGPGLLESSYKPCMIVELRNRGLRFEVERPVPLIYKGMKLNAGYRVDLVVEDQIVVELKCVEALAPIHDAQMMTYLRLLQCPVGLIINFNVPVLKQGIRRVLNSRLLRETVGDGGNEGN